MSSTQGLSQVLRRGAHPDATSAQKREALRVAVNEVVGRTFFGSMLKMARNSAIKSEYGHGGRGEEIFRAQLDDELVTRISQSAQVDFLDAMYDRLARRFPGESHPAAGAQIAIEKDAAAPKSQIEQAYANDESNVEEIARG